MSAPYKSTSKAAATAAPTPPGTKIPDKNPKLVRDSFTIPKHEFAAIETLKSRAISAGISVKKSELLRAGLMALSSMSDAALRKALAAVPTLKTGRPVSEATTGAKTTTAKPARKVTVKPAAKKAVSQSRALTTRTKR
jgi:hypothetical protein